MFMGCQDYRWQLKKLTGKIDHIAQPQIYPGVNRLSHKIYIQSGLTADLHTFKYQYGQ